MVKSTKVKRENDFERKSSVHICETVWSMETYYLMHSHGYSDEIHQLKRVIVESVH